MKKILRRRGVSQIEYGIVAGLIAVVMVSATMYLGGNLGNIYCAISEHLSDTESNCASHVTSTSGGDSGVTSSGSGGGLENGGDGTSDDTTVASMQLLSGLNFSSINGVYDANGNALNSMQNIDAYFGLAPWSDMSLASNQSVVAAAEQSGKKLVLSAPKDISWVSENTGVPFVYSSEQTVNGVVTATYTPMWGDEKSVSLPISGAGVW